MATRLASRVAGQTVLIDSGSPGLRDLERLMEAVAAAGVNRIDDLISTYAQGWTIERMPAVDRNVLRIGVFEIMYADDVPDAVAVSEAMNLVRELSTDESPVFVNGVLGNIVRNKPALSA